jgi:hypothetical protein
MDSVVAETRVTFDTRLFSEDIVILTFKICHNFLESEGRCGRLSMWKNRGMSEECTHPSSLSMLSPNPGVSTTVKAIRMPSSSSSVGKLLIQKVHDTHTILTHVSRFYPDGLLHMSCFWLFDFFVGQHVGLT